MGLNQYVVGRHHSSGVLSSFRRIRRLAARHDDRNGRLEFRGTERSGRRAVGISRPMASIYPIMALAGG